MIYLYQVEAIKTSHQNHKDSSMSDLTPKTAKYPTWLVEEIEVLRNDLGAQSWSAAASLLLALGWEAYTRHLYGEDGEHQSVTDIENMFDENYETWCEMHRDNLPYPHLDRQQNYLLAVVMPPKHGGARDGAGRPPESD